MDSRGERLLRRRRQARADARLWHGPGNRFLRYAGPRQRAPGGCIGLTGQGHRGGGFAGKAAVRIGARLPAVAAVRAMQQPLRFKPTQRGGA